MKKFKQGIFLFHRDFRLEDNRGLIVACDQCEEVLPVFIFDPRQADPDQNEYFNARFFECFTQALQNLADDIALYKGNLQIFKGEPVEILQKIYNEYSFDVFFSNADYSAFARKRDGAIQEWTNKNGISSVFVHDLCLQSPGEVLKKDGTPYTIFTPFFKQCREKTVALPLPFPSSVNFSVFSVSFQISIPHFSSFSAYPISRKSALLSLENIPTDYAQNRDFPWSQKHTALSVFLRMGVISIREAFWAFFKVHGEQSQGILELYWRDFFIHIGFFFPKVFFGKCFHQKYDGLSWENNPEKFAAWCEGKTGYPLVDAGMRELKATGLMHNRVRMVTASFLIKNLHIDWRWGEKFFAQHLLDYDFAVNNGNWQWSASTGCDAAPYFRIFSPISQHQRFDAESKYVHTWLPELQNYTSQQLFTIEKKSLPGYIPCIVYAKEEAEKTKIQYRNIIG